jgi:DNA-binding NarL/FixJ family response regulator
MKDELRVVIAEDHQFFRDGLRHAIESQAGWRVVGEAADGLSALAKISALVPDVAILDIRMPQADGFTVAREIRDKRLPVAVVFLTISRDEDIFYEALALDAKGYVLKDCTVTDIVSCLNAVMSGQHYTSPAMTSYLVNRTRRAAALSQRLPGLQDLSPQERTILKLIGEGRTSREIAADMHISTKTVEAHRLNICNKLEVHGKHALVKFAIKHRDQL